MSDILTDAQVKQDALHLIEVFAGGPKVSETISALLLQICSLHIENERFKYMMDANLVDYWEENARLRESLNQIKSVIEESADSCGFTCMESSIHDICNKALNDMND